ncbi:fibronectin-binding domain-containing protein, partial [Candidatus Pacearchaeota archaeon]|nr:fibronectin-binding domain-containing protein [Candidatus Pacearchaeota archaeon]
MKTQVSSVDLHYLVKELQVLVDGKIDKIFHPLKKELVLLFHVPNVGKKILKVLVGKLLYLSLEKGEYQEPSGFCMFLRKHLSNSRLRKVEQKESERIVEFLFERKEGKEKLIIEFFGGGNVILCDEKGKIISYLEQHKFKERDIK